MHITAVVQMSNDSGPSVKEDVGTGLADVGYMRKQEPQITPPNSILSLSLLYHRGRRLVRLGRLGTLLCHLL